jgi:alkylation response protein AidB-like acyl-CoA dehydrogenase
MNTEISVEAYQADGLPSFLLKELHQKKIFLGFVPKVYGGLEWSLPEGLKTIHHYSSIFGSAGWCVNLGAGAGYFSGFFSHVLAEKVFAHPQACLAGSGQLSGMLESKFGHTVVSGNWGKCTGAGHASHFTVNSLDENADPVSLVIAGNLVNIDHRWEGFAMRPTSSFSISCEYAPIMGKFKIGEVINPHAYAIHKLGFIPFARFCMAMAFAGIGRCLAQSIHNNPKQGEFEDLLLSLETRIMEEAETYWVRLQQGEEIVNDDALQKIVAEGSQKIYSCACEVFYHSGMRIIDENELLHWKYRELLTAIQHFMLK